MGPPLYIGSIVDQIIHMRHITINGIGANNGAGHFQKEQYVCIT